MIDNDYVYGVFLQETRNRFLCTVSIESEEIECYIPSSCRLSNFLDLNGRTVLLYPTCNKKARTRYTVYAVKVGRQFILLNLSKPNRVLENELHNRRFSFLGKRKCIQHEKTIDGYKSDLYIEDTKTIIEIKSVLSFERTAVFPTVYSERGIKQLNKLAELLDGGYRVCYMYVSLNPKVEEIKLNEQITDYIEAINSCIERGMFYCGVTIEIKNRVPIIKKKIPVSFTM